MKKFFLSLIFLSLFLTQSVLAAESSSFLLGKTLFNKKDYKTANTYFVKAITENPNNPTYRYYYAQNLTYLNDYAQARKEYGYVIQLAPNTILSDYSQKSIAYIDGINKPPVPPQTNTVNDIPDNYINAAVTEKGDLVLWDTDKMPVKFYFDNSNRVNNAYVTEAKKALEPWKTATNDKFNYMIVDKPEYADVIVKFYGMSRNAGTKHLGLTNHSVLNGYMHKANVDIYTSGPNYKPLSASDVYNVAVHEYGHVIGIHGHSTSKYDIMFATYDPLAKNDKVILTKRDVNTARGIYEIDKNPYSSSVNSINKVLGSKNDRIGNKLNQALEQIKALPNSVEPYNDAATAYLELGKETDAITYYKKALTISGSDHYANIKLAQLYAKRNDLRNAELYYKNIIKYEPRGILPYLELIDLYLKNNHKQNARMMLNSLLYRNSAAKNDATVQKLMSTLK